MVITSKDNSKIKQLAKLYSNRKYRRETGLFVIEGIRVDQLLIPGTHIPVSQALGMCLFIFAVVTDIVVRVRMKKGLPAAGTKTAGAEAVEEEKEEKEG